MKLQAKVLLTVLTFGLLIVGCSPEHVSPSDQGSGSNALEIGAAVDSTIHKPPSPKCGNDVFTDLVANLGGNTVVLGDINFVNSFKFLHVIYDPDAPLVVWQAAVWRGEPSTTCTINQDPDCTIPLDQNGKPDVTNFDYYASLNPVFEPFAFRIPLNTLYEDNSFSAWAVLVVVSGTDTLFDAAVWAAGKSTNTSAQFLDYSLTNEFCKQACEPWIDGFPQCGCAVPVPGPGDDLSNYECGNGKGSQKVTVCHLPPGNPENMQEICISVNALPAHILDFKPGDNPCMGHHSGCHIGPCDPCGEGSTLNHADATSDVCAGNGGNGGSKGKGKNG